MYTTLNSVSSPSSKRYVVHAYTSSKESSHSYVSTPMPGSILGDEVSPPNPPSNVIIQEI
jgi:hypothetical protein